MSVVTRQSQEALRSMISVPEPLLTLPQPGQEPPTPTCGAMEDLLPQLAQQPKALEDGGRCRGACPGSQGLCGEGGHNSQRQV